MTAYIQKRPDYAFVSSLGNGTQSLSTVKLKTSSVPYVSGEVLVEEFTETTAGSGTFNVATGKFIKASGLTSISGYSHVNVAINGEWKDASAGDVQSLVVDWGAEITANRTTLSAVASAVAPYIAAALKSQGIKAL